MADRRAEPSTSDELLLGRDTGLWAVRSTSGTVYYVDLGPGRIPRPPGRATILRSPGADSPRGPWDGCWLALVSVEDSEGQGRVRIGRRHRWTMDPGGRHPLVWWIQRAVTAIDLVQPAERPAGRAPGPEEASLPFRRRHEDEPAPHPSGADDVRPGAEQP